MDITHTHVPNQAPRIERVETLLLDIPTIRPHRMSVATMNAQTLMIVRLWSSDGIVGIGEGTTIGGMSYGPESPEGIKLTIDTYMAPLLKDGDPTRVRALMAKIGKLIKGNHFAKCAVETALLERHAREVGRIAGPGRVVVEFGSGSSTKTPHLLAWTAPAAYVPIDISGEFLRDSVRATDGLCRDRAGVAWPARRSRRRGLASDRRERRPLRARRRDDSDGPRPHTLGRAARFARAAESALSFWIDT